MVLVQSVVYSARVCRFVRAPFDGMHISNWNIIPFNNLNDTIYLFEIINDSLNISTA